MRILQIINSLGTGGAEKLLLDSIPLYRQAGIEMDVLILWDNDHPFTLALKELNCCNIIVLNQSDNYKDIYSLSNIFKLRKYLKSCDIAHVHLFPALYFVRIANLGLSTKLIFTEHNTQNRRINNRRYRLLEKWCYGRYEKIVCISHEIKTIYENYLRTPEKLVLIENGVDLQKIEDAVAYSKTNLVTNSVQEDVFLLQVSGFRKQKDQDTLIKSLIFLPPNFKALLVGEGERYEHLKSLVGDNDLSDRVVFLGMRMDVPAILKTADFVVLSSHYEGLSLASVEGLACGKPFLASDVPGLREVVGGAGILFEHSNPKDLAFKLLELHQNPTLYAQVVQACISRAKNFDLRTMTVKHVDLYNEVI